MATRPGYPGRNDQCPGCRGGGLVPRSGMHLRRERTYLHTGDLPRVRRHRAMTEARARYVPDGTVQQGQQRFTMVSQASR